MELHKKYRPTHLKNIIGQDMAVKLLQGKIDNNNVPHAILLTGPSGVGKTTIARCLRKPLKCHLREFREYDIGDVGGIDEIRGIHRNMLKMPLYGKVKIYFLDEVAQAKSIAQDGMLKMLEEQPPHVYFILATTDPQRLKTTVRTRLTRIDLKPLKDADLRRVLQTVCDKEERTFDDDVFDKIVEYSDGSARMALNILDSIFNLEAGKDVLEAIEMCTQEKQAIELCRLLLNNRTSWSSIASILKDLNGQDAEGLRRMILGYMRACMLTGSAVSIFPICTAGSKIASRAYYIITCFERNFFDTGHAGLAMACWESMNQK